tara:strand:- start:1735 stop:1926 length:192 start_codon:yes stop_codon:yes gene_type:complete
MKSNFRQFSNILSEAICDTNVENTNVYTPRVRSTVTPDIKLNYTSHQEYLNKELNKIKGYGRV